MSTYYRSHSTASSRPLELGTSATYIRQVGFITSISDTSPFVYKEGTSTAYLLLYVNNIILTASSTALL